MKNLDSDYSKFEAIAAQIWKEYDLKKVGVLDKIEAFKFVNKVMHVYLGKDYSYTVGDFDTWFDQADLVGASHLEKRVIVDYIWT